MSHVARNAKLARTILQGLVALNHVSIERARGLILEARAFEAIFKSSVKTARRRRDAMRPRAKLGSSGSSVGGNLERSLETDDAEYAQAFRRFETKAY